MFGVFSGGGMDDGIFFGELIEGDLSRLRVTLDWLLFLAVKRCDAWYTMRGGLRVVTPRVLTVFLRLLLIFLLANVCCSGLTLCDYSYTSQWDNAIATIECRW